MSLSCEQAIQQAKQVDLESCNLALLEDGGEILTNATYFEEILCPAANNNGTAILPDMDWETTQIAVAYKAVAGCFDTIDATPVPLACDGNAVVVQIDIVDSLADCSQVCKGVQFYHYAVQLPAAASATVNATYSQNCGQGTSAAHVVWESNNGWFMGMLWLALMFGKNL